MGIWVRENLASKSLIILPIFKLSFLTNSTINSDMQKQTLRKVGIGSNHKLVGKIWRLEVKIIHHARFEYGTSVDIETYRYGVLHQSRHALILRSCSLSLASVYIQTLTGFVLVFLESKPAPVDPALFRST